MGRRRAVEGLVLDLTQREEGTAFTLEEVVMKSTVVKRKRIVVTVEGICATCTSSRMCTDVSGALLCFMCYKLRNADPEVDRYIREAYKGPCSLCGIVAKSYHYDHINMFDKSACILDLAYETIDVIAAELARCQLVCVPCHAVITAAEARLGYLKKKRGLKKAERAGKNIGVLRATYASEYERDFAEVYAELRLHGS